MIEQMRNPGDRSPTPLPRPTLQSIMPPAEEGPDKLSKLALISSVLGAANSAASGMTGPGPDYSSLSNSSNGLSFGVQDPYYSGQANNLWDIIKAQFPQVTMGGIFNARNIAGSSKPSEHAYGAALDIMVGNNALGDAVYAYLQGLQNQWGFTNVLWEQPNHYNHLHVGWLY